MSESAELGGGDSNGRGPSSAATITFSDLARAHHGWDSGDGLDAPRRQDFDRKLALFEEDHGKLVEAYWCRKQASAVALAKLKPKPPRPFELGRRLGLGHDVPDFRIYRETDWVTGSEFSKLADLLHECDVLAVKALYGLEGFQQATVMQWLLKVEAHILGYIEWRYAPPPAVDVPIPPAADVAAPAAWAWLAAMKHAENVRKEQQKIADDQLESFANRIQRELSKVEDYYQQAGDKRGRLRYVEGMLTGGVVFVAGAAVLSALVLSFFGLLHPHEPGVRRFYASMAAGAVGAIVSVLIRMSGRGGGFTIDHELGSMGVRRLGAFRPLIGAVSGVVIAFLVQTSLVPIKNDSLTIEFFVAVAFLAGFSERWTKVVLDGAMRTVDKAAGDDESKPPPSPQPGTATHGST